MSRIDWKTYALKLAIVASERSEDQHYKVGACVLRRDNSVGGLGYNGAPSGVNINWENRDERRKRVIHAEVNALRYVKPSECYLLASTLLPCNECLRMLSAYGITEVVFNETYARDQSSLSLAKEFNIKLYSTVKGVSAVSKNVVDESGLTIIDNV